MSILAADVHKAIKTEWDNASLDSKFTTYWAAGETDRHVPLNDGEASPGCPFPYCVITVGPTNKIGRMSGVESATPGRHLNDYPTTFMIHAQRSGAKSAKQIASELSEEIMKIFGGHPTESPVILTLDNGAAIDPAQHISDFGIRDGDEEYMWQINYNFRTEVPVMV